MWLAGKSLGLWQAAALSLPSQSQVAAGHCLLCTGVTGGLLDGHLSMDSLALAWQNKYPKEEASWGEGREGNRPTVFIGSGAGRAQGLGNSNSWSTSVFAFGHSWTQP